MRSSIRPVLIATLFTIGASIGALLIAWIAVTAIGEASHWDDFSKRFETALALCRALIYGALLIGWLANRNRHQSLVPRRLMGRTALTGFASILLVELNRFQG